MVDAYAARPPYPSAVFDALTSELTPGATVLDVGAGLGHLALPLATSGYRVIAIEPAVAMLTELGRLATARALSLSLHHASAEALPLEAQSLDAVCVADALHFLDAELAGLEIRRTLRPGGLLSVLVCEFSDSPFMRSLKLLLEQATPRRQRSGHTALTQLAAMAQVTWQRSLHFTDETALDWPRFEQVLCSISLIGGGMPRHKRDALFAASRALGASPSWGRSFTLMLGRRTQAHTRQP